MNFTRQAPFRMLVVFGAVGGAGLVAGCASGVPKSGFLSDYSQMQRVEDDALVWNYVDRGTGAEELHIDVWVDRRNVDAFGNYNGVLLDPLVFEFKKGSAAGRISSDQLDRLTAAEREAILEILGVRHAIVDQPGEGVMRVRRAVTELRPQRAYDPPDRDNLPEKAFLNSRPGVVTTEMEVVDSLTGEKLAACVIRARGSYLDTDAESGIYQQAKSGLRCVGDMLRYLLYRAHGVATESAVGAIDQNPND